MTIGDLIAFMAYLGQLAWPTTSLSWMISIYQRGKAAMRRLEQIYDSPLPASVPALDGKLEIDGAVEWENVSFSYYSWLSGATNGQPYALRNINVKVRARNQTRHRRAHRRGQNHHDQAVDAVAGAHRRTDPARRPRHPRDSNRRTATT